jgi:hypothetical protein
MILLNYAHRLTPEQLGQATALLGAEPAVREIASHTDRARPLTDVARDLADAAALTPAEWETLPLVINPPALAPIALALMAELHGRCGYFPAIVNVRPVASATPVRYEVAEIVNMQAIRDTARARR